MSVFVMDDAISSISPFRKETICEEFEEWIRNFPEWAVWKSVPGYDYVIVRKIVRRCVYRVNPDFNTHDITKKEFFNQMLGVIFADKGETVDYPSPDLFHVVITDNLHALEKHLENFKMIEEE